MNSKQTSQKIATTASNILRSNNSSNIPIFLFSILQRNKDDMDY